ncbi:hypothetical protein IV203_027456 [Nitzschia inconspicua]|uniref:Uncharacterized protein n=1 Tax=Nitzschia inconspicua TaxID=303405 RepID=A0A9K3LWE7_9STRA|nr:hypothetical protein IV203_027456 [Nitzschia inconspicua]
MNTSSIDAYKEHTWKNEYFERHVLSQPRVICAKSKVAELCGLHMKVYFHEYAHQSHARSLEVPPTVGIQDEEKEMWPRSIINNGASLLTFDPRTGFCDYRILGKAYVIVDGGDYPLSNHQVWGLQDLISEARDIYHCDPEHKDRGMKELLRFAKDYRHQNYEPLTIYKVRDVPWKVTDPSDNLSVKTVYIAEDHIHHHQIQDTGDPSFSRHLDHSYGKYGRVRLAGQPGEEELLETGKGKPNDAHKGRRIPKLFTACHVLD